MVQNSLKVAQRIYRSVQSIQKSLPEDRADHHINQIWNRGLADANNLRILSERKTHGCGDRWDERPQIAQERLTILGSQITDNHATNQFAEFPALLHHPPNKSDGVVDGRLG